MSNVILCGVGGQGTVLAGKLIATAALSAGKSVRGAETIGMAQRGGPVMSCMRIDEPTLAPIAPKGTADLLIGFEPGEAVRCLPYLKENGVVVVSEKAVKPVSCGMKGAADYEAGPMLELLQARTRRLIQVDTEALAAECGSPKVVNVILLGAAANSGQLGLSLAELERAIRDIVPERFLELNLKALAAGAAAAAPAEENFGLHLAR